MTKSSGFFLATVCVAIILLSLIVLFYYVRPVHIENVQGGTDYVWPPHSYWVTLTEGVSVGHYDALGFNNVSVVDNPDILVLGSSHMEGTNIFPSEAAPYLLGTYLKGGYSVYNKGVSGHDFFKIAQYLPINIELYKKKPKFIVLETSTVDVRKKNIDEILSGKVKHTQSHNMGVVGLLQKVPFFRLLYMQKKGGLLNIFVPSQKRNSANTAQGKDDFLDVLPYENLFNYFRSIEDRFGTEIIIVYHPTGEIQKDGSILFRSSERKDLFGKFADEYGISFVDLTADFEKMYYQEHHVAHGFVTGKLERGHLNKYGHAVMAKALCQTIVDMQKEGGACK